MNVFYFVNERMYDVVVVLFL